MIQTHRQAPMKFHGVGIGQDYYNEQADAAEREDYYAPIHDVLERGDGDDLYRSLNGLLRRTHQRDLGYKQARKHLYKTVDRRPDGALYYLYSGEGPKNEEEVDGPNRRRLGGYNCEHVVPQSWFNKRHPMKSDLHHLFTEETRCNSSRANYNLAEVEGENLPSCGIVDHRGDEFEPKAGKGAVARATMYFLVRHPGYVGDRNVETSPEDLKQLLEWHEEYPVTDYERHRNESIQDLQGNRNPFIDFPELAERIDFSAGFAS